MIATMQTLANKPAGGAVPRPPQTSEPAVVIQELRKSYRTGTEAVRGVTLEIRRGEVFGLIGPDGAGKTTVFQILSGIMEPDSGKVQVFGQVPWTLRRSIGYLTQVFSLYQDLSVRENLHYSGEMRGLTPAQIEERGMHYLRLFDMDRFTGRLAGRLSGGMKQKLALACALIAEPQLLLLDEPTTGVDPVSRREFWDTLANLSSTGMTVVVATPYLDEAERCGRVALMYDGLIRQVGTPAQLRDDLGMTRLEVRTTSQKDLGRAEEILSSLQNADRSVRDVQRFGDRLDVMVTDTETGKDEVRRALETAQIPAESEMRAAAPTLENVFVATLQSLKISENRSEATPTDGEAPRQKTAVAATERGQVAIGAYNLTRRFGDFTAVNGIQIEVRPGEIYGLLGANGAGKTTAIKMLCGLLPPSDGETVLAGERGAATRSSEVRQRVGYMSQKFSLYDDLTIAENLDFFGGVYGVPPKQRAEKQRWILDFAGLTGRGDTLTGSLPGGWKQRVAFGSAILHEPDVLFLDEPTSGVDPVARRAFWRVINRLADQGVAILVTTHYLEEAEQCNRLGFMVAGELVAEGTPSGVKAQIGGHLLVLHTDAPQTAANTLKQTMERWRVSLFGDRLHVIVAEEPETALPLLQNRLERAGVRIVNATEEPFSLEDVFIAVVEQARRQGKVAAED
ncbi:MAG: ATP-binding cassette domain-containing protein [Armatimonadaceae bacterium]